MLQRIGDRMLNKDDVNKMNTRTWVKLNEDSKKNHYQKMFLDKYGGCFKKVNRGLIWEEVVNEPQKKEKSVYRLFFPNDEEELVDNLAKFCRENNLNKSALYAILRGERKQHKGFRIQKES
jgi:hypothetical protein